MTPGVAERLWARVDQSGGPDACWPWMGDRNHKGYGRMWRDGKNATTSRIAFELTNGPIPDGLNVLHRCDNPPCSNPAHLFLGTASDNQFDAIAKGRRGWRANNPKITASQAADIRARLRAGAVGTELAREYGIDQSQVSRIGTGRAWPDGGPTPPPTDSEAP